MTEFHAVHGWVNSAVTGSLIIYWVIAASVAPLRQDGLVELQSPPARG
jgi:hypothetical protein